MSRAMVLARPAVAVGLTAVVAGCALAAALVSMYSSFLAARDELDHIEPRYARLAGMLHSEKALSNELDQLRERGRKLSIPADADADAAGAQLQQSLRRLAEESGNTVSVSQVLPRDTAKDALRLAVMLRVEGSLETLMRLLAAIERETPVVFVESLSISRGRQRTGDPTSLQNLTTQINLAAHRLPIQ
ncbi:MAG: hypothetical protein KDG55_01180 [Rhodocyclaceae bacterium]|nr:hypothetical protein [Rhodocyclaceae bacterium]